MEKLSTMKKLLIVIFVVVIVAPFIVDFVENSQSMAPQPPPLPSNYHLSQSDMQTLFGPGGSYYTMNDCSTLSHSSLCTIYEFYGENSLSVSETVATSINGEVAQNVYHQNLCSPSLFSGNRTVFEADGINYTICEKNISSSVNLTDIGIAGIRNDTTVWLYIRGNEHIPLNITAVTEALDRSLP